jgi:hypothetical protein
VVNFLATKRIKTVGDLAQYNITDLASGAARIGTAAITALEDIVKRAGLKPKASASNGSAHAS